ncbi:aldehyde dehydrogenase family protein [Scleromatobacter humisilvae]|uniref:Aldehyde dehydrogenase family protein n=1 Tax=Scleromatobacter humisilvae TaxID=2897159 RepID=A0A9X1YFZ8_9BURK|nr:aldehyde dehydrogenase family protein [Scleromatobacter humisilvae]MCK9684987.1 aldehyde dehydrogenase family protein [Scleromatobacter humisilvae]
MSALALAMRPGVISVSNPFNGEEVGQVDDLPPEAARDLLDVAARGARLCGGLSRHERARLLDDCAALVERDRDAFAALIVAEAGKTIRQAKKSVLRCVNTLRLSADEARRNGGEIVPFRGWAGSGDRQGRFTREPLGVVVAITPYNDPLNLVAHKLGPAIAGGNAVVLKPSELTPLSAIRLVETLVAAGMPSSVVTIATGGAVLGEHALMIADTAAFIAAVEARLAADLSRRASAPAGDL